MHTVSINYDRSLQNLRHFNNALDLASTSPSSSRPGVLLKVAEDKEGRRYVVQTERKYMSSWQKFLSILGRSDYNLNNVLEVLSQVEKEAVSPGHKNTICKTTEYLWQNVEAKKKTATEEKGFWSTIKQLANSLGLSKPSGDVESKLWTLRRQEITVGPEQWVKENIRANDVPNLPDNIDDILKGPCPYFEGKKVHETWKLILIPAGLSIKEIREHRQSRCSWTELAQIADRKVEKSYWALVTAEPIPASANKGFESQKSLLTAKDRVPTVLEALTLNAMCSLKDKWENRHQESVRRPVWTQCEETVMRQNFNNEGTTKCRWHVGGLTIDSMPDKDRGHGEDTGILAVRILS